MKYVFISPHGDGFSTAFKLKQLGKDVVFCFLSDDDGAMGKDMGVEIVDDYHEILLTESKESLILIFDANGKGHTADYLTEQGYYVFGGSHFADMIENDREAGRALMGMMTDTPQTVSFTDFESAKRFAKANKDIRFVFKPDGDGISKEWTYVSKDLTDLMDRLGYYSAHWPNSVPVSFELQEFIEGIECDFCGVFNGKGWIEGAFEWYFESKKAYNDDKGPATGCAHAMQYYTTSAEPYFKDYLSKLTNILRQNNYRGIFSVNNIFDPKTGKFYPLELTPRLGYDSTQNEIHAMIENCSDPGKFFEAVAMGKSLPKSFFPQDLYNVDVRIGIPPYPFYEGAHYAASVDQSKGKTIDIEDSAWIDFFPDDICYNDADATYESAGVCATIGVMCASAETIDGAISDLYDNKMKQIHAPDMFYRTDAAKRVKSELQTLIKSGVVLNRQKI